MNPTTFILVLNWNGWRDTLDCLEALFREPTPGCRVVVLDNGSTDDSLERIRRWAAGLQAAPALLAPGAPCPKPVPLICYSREAAETGGVEAEERAAAESLAPTLVLIRTGANLGFAGGNNVGIRYAQARGAQYLLLLNNDACFRSREALPALLDFMAANPRAGACGGRLFYPDGSPQQCYGNFPAAARVLACLFPLHKLVPAAWLARIKRSNVTPGAAVQGPLGVDWPSGACLMVRSAMIDEVGLLDERYFLYLEETDWCFRMRTVGWDRYYLPAAEVTHRFGGSFGTAPQSMQRYHLESQFTYYRKHFSRAALAAVIAGYILRAVSSLICRKLARLLRPRPDVAEPPERAGHWRLALRLAIDAIPVITAQDIIVTRKTICHSRLADPVPATPTRPL